MTEQQTPKQIPKNDYETVEGTAPQPYVAHEPRTVVHTRSNSDDDLVAMMTEIGDGTFVQWTHCNKCKNGIKTCTCPEGPVPSDFIERWRGERFERSLKQRPDPDFPLLPSVLEWVKERGYMVIEPQSLAGVITAAQEAQDLSLGDSNDDEIDGLRTALEEALGVLGLELPDPIDPDEEDDEEERVSEIEHTGKHEIDAQAEEDAHAAPARNLDDIPDDF